MTEAVSPSETSVTHTSTHQATRYYIPEGSHIHSSPWETQNSPIAILIYFLATCYLYEVEYRTNTFLDVWV
jgi:hypothetical protein